MQVGERAPLSGYWDQNTWWEFKVERKHPPVEQCAAIGAVVLGAGGIVLTQTHRGCWELPGGHVEEGETVLEALIREVREEVAMRVLVHELFGHVLVRSKEPRINPSTGKVYPSPGSIPHFLCWGEAQDCRLGGEIVEVRHVSLHALKELDLLDIPERGILEIGLAHTKLLPQLSQEDRHAIQAYLALR